MPTNKAHKENFKEKHKRDAKYGWYRYDSRFALPVFDEEGEIKYYNVFKVIMVVRHAEDGKMYLYDIMNIKKRNGYPFPVIRPYSVNSFLLELII